MIEDINYGDDVAFHYNMFKKWNDIIKIGLGS